MTMKYHQEGNPFDGADIVSVYADAQAVEDGVLVDIGSLRMSFQGLPVNRMTRNLWAKMEPFFSTVKVPDDLPLAVVPAAMSVGEREMDLRRLASAIHTKLRYAHDPEPGHAPTIFHLPPNLWMMENDAGGWTVMLPEDY